MNFMALHLHSVTKALRHPDLPAPSWRRHERGIVARNAPSEADDFVERYADLVLVRANQYAWRFRVEPDELAQRALIRLWKYLRRGGLVKFSPEGLIRKTVIRTAIDMWRERQQAKEKEELLRAIVDHEAVNTGRPGADENEGLRECLTFLSDRERQVILMAYVDDMTHEEVAHAQGISVPNSRVVLLRARRKVRKCLAARGIVSGR